ncbi:MAG TPA: hypothetical protein VM145_05170 [Sphingomicrobium sp.]|nr:hypothetical protein [Sphingomicrobium sp.]
MQLARPAFAPHPRLFGRGPVRDMCAAPAAEFTISGDLKLFASTFLVGFLFVSVLIA